MTAPTITATSDPVATLDGQLACDWCPAVYAHPYVIDHPDMTPRHQLRQAASRDGWKQTSGGLETCPACAADTAAFLIPGWTLFWSPDRPIAPAQPDPESTLIVPVRLLDAATRRALPYPPATQPATPPDAA